MVLCWCSSLLFAGSLNSRDRGFACVVSDGLGVNNLYNGTFEKNGSRTHSHGEEAQLSSGGISIVSELSSPNFNSSVTAKESFAIRYPNVLIKSLCSNLGICLNYYAFGRRPRPKVKDGFFNNASRSRFLTV